MGTEPLARKLAAPLDWTPCSCVYVVNYRWPMVCWSFDAEYLIPSPVMGEG